MTIAVFVAVWAFCLVAVLYSTWTAPAVGEDCDRTPEYKPNPDDPLEGDLELPFSLVRPAFSCPHGFMPGECDACDRAADLAYDAARESR